MPVMHREKVLALNCATKVIPTLSVNVNFTRPATCFEMTQCVPRGAFEMNHTYTLWLIHDELCMWNVALTTVSSVKRHANWWLQYCFLSRLCYTVVVWLHEEVTDMLCVHYHIFAYIHRLWPATLIWRLAQQPLHTLTKHYMRSTCTNREVRFVCFFFNNVFVTSDNPAISNWLATKHLRRCSGELFLMTRW